ncbi:protein FAM110B-like isoform X1 [Haliotis rubra]|uniref:protein FAM110B-like isoform X1 n=1 Tax=Haliotis rubra TaxID=36100 RepID=UPI001EE5C9E1|nr:protein FAM110B-like isoform X1 [Haliotis rubra]XP_046554613.1 protein FAM110B-like isoform X1 [Haliotis rubra]
MKMALLVTSCTMGKQPSRLLDKGPSYLRTRTNTKLFARRRRSSVETLEASRPQYVKSSNSLDHRPASFHFPDSFNIFGRCTSQVTTTQPPRSKSEYNLHQLIDDCNSHDSKDNVDGDANPGEDSPRQQQQCNPLASRHTPHRPTEAAPVKINMSERASEISNTSPHRRVPCVDSNERKCVSSGVSRSRDTRTSLSCQNLGEMAGDRVLQVVTTPATLPAGVAEVESEVNMESTCTPVHRSHSDLNCRHVRDSSVASDKSSRYSRASADLEKFFNQMGLERNVLDPMLRLQEVQGKKEFEMFESVSSLDSPDTRSICSGVSRSEKAHSDTEATDKTLSTSVVERNARIIKWLCSVKKAKTNVPGHT